MLMNDDKKRKMVSVILAKSKSEKAPSMESSDEQDRSMGIEAAAEELIAAIDSKDKSRVASSFKALSQMCSDEAEYMDSRSESESES